ncbi:MAG: DUF3108 domain-containing protein [Actinomycetota bacterium]|nr:DUF3108 domain-containing protein [Actinomycetota bacterium]
MKLKLAALLSFLLVAIADPSRGDSFFKVPETLQYQLVWNGIHAGDSSLTITDTGNSEYKIVSEAHSAKFISLFYTVDDRAVSIVRKGSLTPLEYHINVHEGHTRKNKEYIFPQNQMLKTTYIDYEDKDKESFNTPPGILDPLSSFYYLRTIPLEIGRPVYVKIFDSKKVYDVKVRVIRKERVNTWVGSFNTILVNPILKSEGIFAKKGKIYIWLTDDDKRVPVMLETGTKIGAIKAILKQGDF